MTTAGCPVQEPLHKIVYELLCALHGQKKSLDSSDDTVKLLLNQLILIYDQKIGNLDEDAPSNDLFEEEWSALTWSLLTVLSRLRTRTIDIEEGEQQKRLNVTLVSLVNKARPVRPPRGMAENDYRWIEFFNHLAQTLNILHNLYSQLDSPSPSLEPSITSFGETQLRTCVEVFRRLCVSYSATLHSQLRMAQLDRMANFTVIPDEPIRMATAYYSNVLYTLGILALRLQGFRYESLLSKYPYSLNDPVRNLMDTVFFTVEQLLSDCLFATEPSTNAILVTNNLFTFNCGCLAKGISFKQFDVQIVSEETAQAIQMQMNKVRNGQLVASHLGYFPSAALLAMKPTSGVKRNNATANAEGGNTAHKKSDVNSKESVVLSPTFNEKHNSWNATYPHLLCTTRQKDTVLLDNRSGQIGKRPLFYFYIRGTIFSPTGALSYIRSLSLPFTIATRRNQDCQVQRMMSSYTATCFWLYGTSSHDGLIFNWRDNGIEWSRFKKLYRTYFCVNAEVTRTLSDSDVELLKEKMECEDCKECNAPEGGERLVTFKNVLCPHLRYETEQNMMRFSIWRGILEVLQIFQDPRTNVKVLWDDYILLGFADVTEVNNLLMPHSSVMCLRISYVAGGSICVTIRSEQRQTVHLEPIELKKLQTKSVFEYLADIAESANINYILTAHHSLIRVSEVVRKHSIGADVMKMKDVSSNITHTGSLEEMHGMRFSPLRIAVVTCREVFSALPVVPTSSHSNGYANTSVLHLECSCNSRSSFADQLDQLMKAHGKTADDVLELVGYTGISQYTVDQFIPPQEYR